MRRLHSVLFCCVLALAFDSVTFAQRGNGGGRGEGGFAGSTFSSAPRSFAPQGLSSTAIGAGARLGPSPLSSTAIGAGATLGGAYSSRFRGRSLRNGYGVAGGRRDYRNVPYPYFFSPYYYPFLDYGDAPYGDAPYGSTGDPTYDPNMTTGLVTENLLGEQVQRLTAEVDQLRYAQPNGPGGFAPPVSAEATPAEPSSPPITVILRNGQKLQVQNYAVMSGTFWDFSKQPARKIPLANIDLAASSQATAANGGEFPEIEAR